MSLTLHVLSKCVQCAPRYKNRQPCTRAGGPGTAHGAHIKARPRQANQRGAGDERARSGSCGHPAERGPGDCSPENPTESFLQGKEKPHNYIWVIT